MSRSCFTTRDKTNCEKPVLTPIRLYTNLCIEYNRDQRHINKNTWFCSLIHNLHFIPHRSRVNN